MVKACIFGKVSLDRSLLHIRVACIAQVLHDLGDLPDYEERPNSTALSVWTGPLSGEEDGSVPGSCMMLGSTPSSVDRSASCCDLGYSPQDERIARSHGTARC